MSSIMGGEKMYWMLIQGGVVFGFEFSIHVSRFTCELGCRPLWQTPIQNSSLEIVSIA